MSWSEYSTSTSAYGIVESYHRVIIKIYYSELSSLSPKQLQKYQTLSQNLFYHFLIILTPDDLKSNDSSDKDNQKILRQLQSFVQSRYLETYDKIQGEISPSKEFLSKQLGYQRYMFSIQIPLHPTLQNRVISLLSVLTTSSLTRESNYHIYVTYVIFQLLHEEKNIYQTSEIASLSNKASHHVYNLIPSSTSSVNDYHRIDDYNNIKQILFTISSIQQSLVPLLIDGKRTVYWGINANNIAQEHDYLDYFLLTYQELTQTQASNTNFQHKKPPNPLTPMIYNQTDENLDHGKDPNIYGSEKQPLAVELHAVFLTLSSNSVANFRTETTDLIHSFGLNTILEIPYSAEESFFFPYLHELIGKKFDEEASSISTIRELAAKYSTITIETFVCKCLLQLGNCLVFSFQFPLEDFLLKHISRLCHPFNYRKEYVSTVKIISIPIDVDDLETLRSLSEENEMKDENIKRSNIYLQPPVIKEWKIQSNN
eukprot:gene9543-10361_t